MNNFRIFITGILLFSALIGCNPKKVASHKKALAHETNYVSWFGEKKYGELELARLEYLENIYRSNDLEANELYDVYVDSIRYLATQLALKNIDGLSYSEDSLIKATNNFLKYVNALYSAEIDPSPGTDYFRYQQDQINYDLISYYFRLKSFGNLIR